MPEKKQAPKKRSKAAKPKETRAPARKAPRSQADASEPGGARQAIPSHDGLDGKIYTTSLWKHLPNYECLWCAFSTVDHETALSHFKEEHQTRPPEARVINTGLVDKDGEPIKRVEPAEED